MGYKTKIWELYPQDAKKLMDAWKTFFFFRRFVLLQDAWKIFPPGCMKDDVFISLLEAFDGEKIWGEIGLWLHNVKVEIKYAQDMPSMNKIPWNPADTIPQPTECKVGIWHDTSSLKLWKVTNQVQKVTSSSKLWTALSSIRVKFGKINIRQNKHFREKLR